MDNRIRRVPVTIHGREYLIRTDESVQYINRLVGMLEGKMEKISLGNPNISEIKLTVLTALTVLDQYNKLKNDYEKLLVSVKNQEEESTADSEDTDPDQSAIK